MNSLLMGEDGDVSSDDGEGVSRVSRYPTLTRELVLIVLLRILYSYEMRSLCLHVDLWMDGWTAFQISNSTAGAATSRPLLEWVCYLMVCDNRRQSFIKSCHRHGLSLVVGQARRSRRSTA